ncbi:MAG: DNA internalization-related competence protein ComEC/Rec2, partial [Gammaproteobacteria bacterium RIFOXYB2_FULL_38_6]
ILLTWYGKTLPSLHVNDHWQLQVKLKPPHGLHNPGGFNYQQWLMVENISATGYVQENNKNIKLNSFSFFSINAFREAIVNEITHSVSDINLSGILQALSVGYRGNLPDNVWQSFQRTGTNHLVAISGLHIGLITAMIYFLVSWLWRQSSKLLLYYPAQKAASIAAILIAVCYGALAGFSIPTQRAVMMIVVVMGESLINRWTPIYFRLLLALAAVLTLQPLSVFSDSFWLSFAAVFWIAYGMTYTRQKKIHLSQINFQRLVHIDPSILASRRGGKEKATGVYKQYMTVENDDANKAERQKTKGLNWFQKWLHLQTIIFFGLLPFTFLFFNQVSLVLFPANLVAIPWIGFIILPLCLFACFVFLFSKTLACYIFKLAAFLLKPFWIFLNWTASFPQVVWHHSIVSAWEFLSLMLGALLLLTKRLHYYRLLGLLFFLPLFLYHPYQLNNGEFRFTLLDVGQGLASVIQTQHHVLIYDTGPHYYSGFDAGASVVIPYLQRIGADSVDVMIVSHSDNDHSGGAVSILKNEKVKKFLTSIPKKFKPYPAQFCYAGQHWTFDGVQFEMLWPPKNLPYLDNNSSCVLKVFNTHHSLLLTGDIEKWAEEKIVQNAKNFSENIKTEILVAPHHGSKTSSSLVFLKAVQPKEILFSSGFENRFHFPSQAVIKRCQMLKITMLNTAVSGAVQIKTKGDALKMRGMVGAD